MASRPTDSYNGASFLVPLHIMERMLQLAGMPNTVELAGAEFDFHSAGVRFYIRGHELPEVRVAERAPMIFPMICETATPIYLDPKTYEGKWVRDYSFNFKKTVKHATE